MLSTTQALSPCPRPAPAPHSDPLWASRGSSTYRRISVALFLAGFSTFSLLYCVQPLLPLFAADFRVSPAASSLALSLATGFLAVAIFAAAALSEGLPRRGLMFASMAAAAILNIVAAAVPWWPGFLVVRALEGLVLGGVPAVAMAYLAEEIDPKGLGLSMGLYVAGTAFGGMAGRVGTGVLTQFISWRAALGLIGAIDLLTAIGFVLLLPSSRNFVPRKGAGAAHHLRAWAGHLRHPGLASLFAIGFLLMGAFVTVYNYAGFRLVAAPYDLSQTEIGLIFTAYLFGMAASSIAGGLADRFGRGAVLPVGVVVAATGAGLTLLHALAGVIFGIGVLTIGFFIAHAVASGWVGRLATKSKGHATSLYLLAYYLGSSVMGSIGGRFWSTGGWPAVVGFALALLALALVAVLRLRRLAEHRADLPSEKLA